MRGMWAKVPGKRLLQQSFFYTFINFMAAFGPLALIPFLTRVLSTESYGVFGNFMAAVSVAGVLVSLNMDLVVRRNGADTPAILKKWIAAALMITLLLSVLGIAVAVLAAWQWPILLEMVGIPFTYLPLVVLGGSLGVLHNLGLYTATMRHNIKMYALIRLGSTFLFVALSFALFLGWRQVVGDVLLARLISLAAAAVVGLYWLHRLGALPRLSEWPLGSRLVPPGLRYGIPILPSIFYDPFMSLINRIVLTNHENLGTAGQYALAYQLAQPLQLVSGSMSLALFPYMVRWFEEATPEARTRLIASCLAATVTLVAMWAGYTLVVLPVAAPWLSHTSYAAAIPLVAPLALGFVMGGIATVVANRYFHSGQTWWISFCCLLGLAANVILSLVFPTLTGVSWALTAGYTITCLWLVAGSALDAKRTPHRTSH